MANRNYYREKKKSLRRFVISLLGGKCVRCGFSDERALQLDHINDNGCVYAYRGRHASLAIIKDIKEHKDRYQLLCANCNWIKRAEKMEELRKIPGNVWRNYRKQAEEAAMKEVN